MQREWINWLSLSQSAGEEGNRVNFRENRSAYKHADGSIAQKSNSTKEGGRQTTPLGSSMQAIRDKS